MVSSPHRQPLTTGTRVYRAVLRRAPTIIPARPVPSKNSVPGSGTLETAGRLTEPEAGQEQRVLPEDCSDRTVPTTSTRTPETLECRCQ